MVDPGQRGLENSGERDINTRIKIMKADKDCHTGWRRCINGLMCRTARRIKVITGIGQWLPSLKFFKSNELWKMSTEKSNSPIYGNERKLPTDKSAYWNKDIVFGTALLQITISNTPSSGQALSASFPAVKRPASAV